MMKSLSASEKDREVTHQLVSQTKQNKLGEINLIYCQSNQSRVMRNKKQSSNIFLLLLPSSQTQLHSGILYLLHPSTR